MNKAMKLIALLAGMMLMTSCSVRFNDVSLPLRREIKEVGAGAARTAHVKLEMGAGDLTVQPASLPGSLMRASLVYNESAGIPQVSYAVQGGTGKLIFSQTRAEETINLRTYRNTWNVQLNDSLTEQLTVALGAGNANLMLAGMPLRDAQIAAGAGNVFLDLTGKWENDVKVNLAAGAGRVELRLPDETGVEVIVTSQLGGLRTDGLNQVASGAYHNDTFGVASTTLRVSVSAGVGEVVLTVAH